MFVIALGILGLAAAIAFGVARIAGANRADALCNEAREAMMAIRSAAYRWHVLHGESTCPSLRQLVEGRFLARGTRNVDPWEQPFVITCGESGAMVTSFGPDGKRATSDDIVVATPNIELGNGK
jgi:hypothetical protein